MNTEDIRFKYADKTTLGRIQLMHPKLRADLLNDYLDINMKLPKGVRLRFSQTFRTFKEQDDLFNKRPKVTNAKGGQSFHNYGLAFDIVILLDSKGDGSFSTASWNVDKYWMAVVNHFKSKGWFWGGDFKNFKDNPHFEKTFGYSCRDLINKVSDKKPYPEL